MSSRASIAAAGITAGRLIDELLDFQFDRI
jgi:hypothetical protein